MNDDTDPSGFQPKRKSAKAPPKVTVKEKNDEICEGFSRMLTQEFRTLRLRLAVANDIKSLDSVDVIIAGLVELTEAVGRQQTNDKNERQFTTSAFDIFSNLGRTPNDARFLKSAGTHYLVEWQLPQAALHHFTRAREMDKNDETLPILIEIADLSLKRRKEIEGEDRSKIIRFPQSRTEYPEI